MRKFIVYTLIGSIIWNSGLTYIGINLGQKWKTMLEYSDYIDIAVVIGVIVVIMLFVKSTRNKSAHKST